MSADPELLAALKDPSRNFNQDETSVQLGNNRQKVLACRGTKLLYHVSSSTRDHITISFTVSAKGRVVPPRCVFKGVRNVALQHLKDLSSDGAIFLNNAMLFSYGEKQKFLFLLSERSSYSRETKPKK